MDSLNLLNRFLLLDVLTATLCEDLKGRGRIFQHLNQVSKTQFHELLGGFQKKIEKK